MNEKQKKAIIFLGVLLVIIVCFGAFYAFKHKDDGAVLKKGSLDAHYYGSKESIDSVPQPTPNVKVNLTTSPNTKGTITEINYDTFKKLFQTSNKSILILVKDGCSFCEDFEPKVTKALKDNNAFAYKINLTKLSTDEIKDIHNYVGYDGTPMTYIIQNGKATHSFSGTTEEETISAFIEYFYVRNN